MRTVPPTEKGKYRAIASGAIANGKPVVVNSTGTVSVVSGSTSAAGAEAVFESAVTQYIASTFDSSNNKVVIAYRDRGNSDYGTAIVATIDSSNNTISYGSPTVFNSANSLYISPTFDNSNNKVVIAYQNGGDSSHGYAIVGTVSGTSISFGTHVEFENATTNYISATFDSDENRVVIAYSDAGNSNYGTAIIGTVSSTSISFGSPIVYESDTAEYISSTFDSSNNRIVVTYRDGGDSGHGKASVGIVNNTEFDSFGTPVTFESASTFFTSTTFDNNSNKVIINYRDAGNSNYGTAIVGTVSGTSISFGTAVVFENGTYIADHRASTFDSTNNKVIIAYQDGGNSNKGTVIEGTVSGTSISFATAVLFNDADTDEHTSVIYDSNSNRSLIGFHDNGNSSYGTGVVYSTSVPTNLTTENYIGIANSCSFHGATETFTVTVASGALYGGGGTGNVFYLNGLSNPPIQLLKGHTYIFDQSDSSNSGHPLHFKNTGGSQYTSGVTVTGSAGSSGAKVTIVIPSDATEPSQYYCTSHGNGMGNLITIGDSFVNVDVIGTVNDQQSSLTAGQQYFVQTDGTLSETADSPSVFAGTAISATELIVKE